MLTLPLTEINVIEPSDHVLVSRDYKNDFDVVLGNVVSIARNKFDCYIASASMVWIDQ